MRRAGWLLSLALVLAGCSALGSGSATPTPQNISADPVSANLTPTPRDPIPGSPMVCDSYLTVDSGPPLDLLPGRYLRLSLCENTIDAYAGCNYLSGQYAIRDGRLFATEMSRTLIGCDKRDDDQDNMIQAFLEAGQTFEVEPDWLTIGAVHLFREPVRPSPAAS